MGYRVLYVEKSNSLKLFLDNLKIENNQGELLIPIRDIQILVIDNYKSVLTVPLLNKLTDENVCVIICGVDHLPKSYVLPMNGHYAQSGNIRSQIEWTTESKGLLHQLIVKAKIYNQIEILKKNNKSFECIQKLYEFMDTVEFDDETNREGLAAKMYFRELFGPDFIRFEDDVINAGLNYGYSIFRSLISSIIVAKGYLPNLGIFHRGKTNMFNLSDDLIEVFRPIVDVYVYNHLRDEILFKSNHREELIQLTIYKVEIEERYQTVSNAIYVYFESILKTIDSKKPEDFQFPLPHIKYDL